MEERAKGVAYILIAIPRSTDDMSSVIPNMYHQTPIIPVHTIFGKSRRGVR